MNLCQMLCLYFVFCCDLVPPQHHILILQIEFTILFLIVLLFLNAYPLALRENCLNAEFFLVCIFPHSDWIRRDTPYLSVFCPNTGKYGPEKTPYLDTFHAVLLYLIYDFWEIYRDEKQFLWHFPIIISLFSISCN